MKKIGIILFLMTLILTSCSNDDDDNLNVDPLIGSWEFIYTEDSVTIKQILTFNANKSGNVAYTITFLGENESETENFIWSVSGNNIIIKIDGETGSLTAPFSISGNKLTVTIDGETFVYTRK